MLFNSLEFLIFAAVFFALWRFARSDSARWCLITAMSFVFYGWWDWRFLGLLLATGLTDYSAALAIHHSPRHKRIWLVLSLTANLGVLGFFKYFNFFSQSAVALAQHAGLDVVAPTLAVVLPVGISFYTFESMSYTIDVYRGDVQPTRNVLHFFAFLSLFPHLVAGPILRPAELLPQLVGTRPVTSHDRWIAAQLVLRGYFKKVVIADNLAPVVNHAFGASAHVVSAAYWWVIVLMFASQIYCDFSGYSDIARGLGRFMGLDFCANFRHPYTATSMREFWTRWHISLSNWFRDYVYIPLGGARRGRVRAHINLWITMLASGLWHGAQWTFVLWGAMHAAFMSIERTIDWPKLVGNSSPRRALAALVVLAEVISAWVLFRAESLSQAAAILRTMYDPSARDLAPLREVTRIAWIVLILMITNELRVFITRERKPDRETRPEPYLPVESWQSPRHALVCAALIVTIVFLRGPGGTFIYFNF